jgi:hypothetical protein
MSRIIFATGNYTRRPEFQIRTVATKLDDGSVSFNKQTTSGKSFNHLLDMENTWETVSHMGLSDLFSEAKLESNRSISFEQVKGVSLENLILDASIAGDEVAINEYLDLYEGLLKRLTARRHDHNYDKKIFGDKLFEIYAGSACIHPGILDLNLDNIISYKKKGLKIIDYEWAYAHCLPYDYVLARALLWLSIRYNSLFRLNSLRIGVTSLSDSMSIPTAIVTRYPSLIKAMNFAYKIESGHFQPWVTGTKNLKPVKKLTPAKFAARQPYALDDLVELRSKLAESNQKLHETELSLIAHKEHLRAITESTAFKTARVLQRAKGKLVK